MYRFPFICLYLASPVKYVRISCAAKVSLQSICVTFSVRFCFSLFGTLFFSLARWILFTICASNLFYSFTQFAMQARLFFSLSHFRIAIWLHFWLRFMNSCMWNSTQSIYGKNVCSAMREKNPNYRIKKRNRLDLCVCICLGVCMQRYDCTACAATNRRTYVRPIDRTKERFFTVFIHW